MADDGIPIIIEEWMNAHPALLDSVDLHACRRVPSLPFKVVVPGAKRFFQYAFETAAKEDEQYHVIDGEFNFACDAGNILLAQCGLRYRGKTTSVDLRTFGDAGSIRMLRLLIRNMVGYGKTLDTPVMPPPETPRLVEPPEDLSVDMDAGLNGRKAKAWITKE